MAGWLNNDLAVQRPLVNNLQRIHYLQLLSLAPIIIAALFNTGYQYLNALAINPPGLHDDLRSRLANLLGASFENPGWSDLLAAGFAHLGPMLAVALVTGGFWERITANKRDRSIESDYIVIAVIFTLLLPGAASFVHIIFGMSFAILIGKVIFGGEGKSFLSPALLGIAIVQVSYPGASGSHPLWDGVAGYAGSEAIALYHRGGEAALATVDINFWSAFVGSTFGPMGSTSILAIALGASLLVYKRLISWRLLAAQFIGLILMSSLFNLFGAESGVTAMPAHWHLLLGSFFFCAVYLGCDPLASASTNPGRWVQGLFIGALVVLIRVANSTHPDAVIPALLLASLLAPLIDHAVIEINIRKRARRHV